MSSACANYVVKESALSFQEGSSDKVYYVSLERVENDKCVVNFAFGRRGNALQTGTKTNEPVDFTTANRIFDKLVQEKMKKGYKGRQMLQDLFFGFCVIYISVVLPITFCVALVSVIISIIN